MWNNIHLNLASQNWAGWAFVAPFGSPRFTMDPHFPRFTKDPAFFSWKIDLPYTTWLLPYSDLFLKLYNKAEDILRAEYHWSSSTQSKIMLTLWQSTIEAVAVCHCTEDVSLSPRDGMGGQLTAQGWRWERSWQSQCLQEFSSSLSPFSLSDIEDRSEDIDDWRQQQHPLMNLKLNEHWLLWNE